MLVPIASFALLVYRNFLKRFHLISCRWMSLRLAYTEAQGLPALRRTIAAMYDEVSMNEVVCCAPEEGIYLTMRAILRPGDHVVVTFPAYESLFAIAEAIGCTVSAQVYQRACCTSGPCESFRSFQRFRAAMK